jgi:hypothetical protein
MDVNLKYCQSCHLISRNGFIIRKIMSSHTGLKILENKKNIQSIVSVDTNILLRRFRLKFLRIMCSTSCYKERLNFKNTLYNEIPLLTGVLDKYSPLVDTYTCLVLTTTVLVCTNTGHWLFSFYSIEKMDEVEETLTLCR